LLLLEIEIPAVPVGHCRLLLLLEHQPYSCCSSFVVVSGASSALPTDARREDEDCRAGEGDDYVQKGLFSAA
jgi:hypothetical protein